VSQNPAPVPEYDVKKLAGMHDTYRIRRGNVRVEYEVDWESKWIAVLTVEFRARAYR